MSDLPDDFGAADPAAGGRLLVLDDLASVAVVVAGAAGAASPDRFATAGVVVAGVLFAVGVVALLWGYALGIGRSRTEHITLGGLFVLSGTAPQAVRRRFRIALAVQTVAAVAAAAARPYTAVAFLVLAPTCGLGLMAAWAGRHGTFFAKGDPRIEGSVPR